MKTIFITLSIFILALFQLSAQSNWPMAIEITPHTPDVYQIPEQRNPAINFRWEISQPVIAAGDRVTLTLRVQGRGNNRYLPQSGFFMPEVPQGVILSIQPVTTEERNAGIAVKLLLIPLTAGDFYLPARELQHRNIILEIPALRLRITERAR
jgi:hypothetical protein